MAPAHWPQAGAQWQQGPVWGSGREWAGHGVTGADPSTEQQAASRAQREQELAANAFQELDDDMDGV